MKPGRQRIGCVGWSAIVLVLGALAFAGVWIWARETESVATLDRLDSLFTGNLGRTHVLYGKDPAQQLFVYGERGAQPRPVLVFIHGGSWDSGDPADYGFIARNFAPHGYVVVLAGYRLGEKGRFPAMLEDSAAAVAWVHAHIGEYGGDPGRIVLMGHSAGAYDAAMIALDRQWLARNGLTPAIIRGVIGLAGPYDFYPFDTQATLAAFGQWRRPRETQPIAFARGEAPPMLLVSGEDDTTVRPRNSVALARALSDAGAPTEPVILPGLDHAGILLRLARPFDTDGRVKEAALAFLARMAESGPASAPVQPEAP